MSQGSNRYRAIARRQEKAMNNETPSNNVSSREAIIAEIVRINRANANSILNDGHGDQEDLPSYAASVIELRQRLNKAQEVVIFFASAIKSGESWSEVCESEKNAALGNS